MTCGNVRKILYLADRLEAASPSRLEADAHLHGCPDCQAFFADEEALKEFLRGRSPRQPVPAHLRENILEQISEDEASPLLSNRRTRRKRARGALAAVAAGVCLVVGIIGYTALTHDRQEQFVAGLIEDHLRFRPGASEISSSRFEQVEAWFAGKVDFAVQAPRFEQSELLGGRLCYLDGKKGAWLFYRKQGALLSFFIFDGTDIAVAHLRRRASGEQKFGLGVAKGQRFILWKDQGLVYALVSDLPEDDLVRLASDVTSPRSL